MAAATIAKKKGRAVVLLSGGIDSAACCRLLIDQGMKVRAMHVDYGQTARIQERRAVRRIAKHYHIPLRILSIDTGQRFSSGEILGRNLLLLSSALMSFKKMSGLIALGIHSGTPYYDCSKQFANITSTLISECSDGRASLYAPFLKWSKGEVYSYALEHGIPIEMTYSCERGQSKPCGVCLSCKDRKALVCS